MKKKLVLVPLLVAGVLTFTGCNKSIIDTNYTFNRAMITVGNDYFVVDVKSWQDYEGEQLQIVATDGTVYLVSADNTVLLKEVE